VPSSHFKVSARCDYVVGTSALLWGEKDETSKEPSWRWVTGMLRGRSSDVKVCMKVVRAVVIRDSGRWKDGKREDIMLGVRSKTEGFATDSCGW